MATYRNKQDDTIIRGSEFKLNVYMEPIDGHHMSDSDVDFICKFICGGKTKTLDKDDMYPVYAQGQSYADNYVAPLVANDFGKGMMTIRYEADIPDAMIGARKYVIELRKYGTISQLTLMDTKTGASVSVFHDGWACGRQNQLYGFYCESGTLPTLSNFGVYSAKNPDIVFAGDSITEGVYVSDRQYTYANRFRSDMPSKSVVVSARGGQTISGLMSLFTTEWNIVRPKAISLLIGANGGNSASNFTAFKNACDAIGAKLYVHYCSCRTGRDLSETNNTLVPNLHLESAHFDWATATDNTPNSSYSNINSSLFADSTHPNITGQAEMYKRLKIDCPSRRIIEQLITW